MQLPVELERHILKSIGLDNFNAENARIFREKLNKLKTELRGLSENYHSANASSDGFMDPYFAYNFPLNFMKSFYIGTKLNAQRGDELMKAAKFSILDLGCGEGAGMYGLFYALSADKTGVRFCLTGIDASASMIGRSAGLGRALSVDRKGCSVEHRKMDVGSDIFKILGETGKRYDIVLFSNSLIEIIKTGMLSYSFIDDAFSCMTSRGSLIMIEPALKDCARRLMGLRNIIARDSKYEIIMPCGHNSECPLLAVEDQEDWCHFSVPWQPPAYLSHLNQGLNREVDMLKFSYLVLSKPVRRDTLPRGHIVISRLIREKGKRKLFLCAPSERIEVYRLDKDKSGSNLVFDIIKSGDTIVLENHVEKRPDLWRIDSATKVTILD